MGADERLKTGSTRNAPNERPTDGHGEEALPIKSLQREWLDDVEPHAKWRRGGSFAPLRYAALVLTGNAQIARAVAQAAPPDVTVHVVASVAELREVWNRLDVASSIAITGDLDELGRQEASLLCMARWPRAPLVWLSRDAIPTLPRRSSRSMSPIPQLAHARVIGGLGTPEAVGQAARAQVLEGTAERRQERERVERFLERYELDHPVSERCMLALGHHLPKAIVLRVCGLEAAAMYEHGRHVLFRKTGAADWNDLARLLEWLDRTTQVPAREG